MDTITTFPTINLPDGRVATLIVPELVEQLAVVDLNVIKRLAQMLPSANYRQIRNDFKLRLDSCDNLESYVTALRDELSFHETVNMITAIPSESVQPEVRVPETARAY